MPHGAYGCERVSETVTPVMVHNHSDVIFLISSIIIIHILIIIYNFFKYTFVGLDFFSSFNLNIILTDTAVSFCTFMGRYLKKNNTTYYLGGT